MSTSAEALTPSGGERAPEKDCGLLGLVLLAQFHGVAADPGQLRHQFSDGGKPLSETDILLAAKSLELKAKVVAQPASRMATASLPALAMQKDGRHFLVAKVVGEQVLIHDIEEGRPRPMSMHEFEARYEG